MCIRDRIYTTPVMWPDFRLEHLGAAIQEFQSRERRFGMTGAQVETGGGARSR